LVFRIVDLFCGCGGLSCGFVQEGFEIMAGIDTNTIALKTFSQNFHNAMAVNADLSLLDPADLRAKLRLEPGELDCLVGGPPCQGFSKNVPAAQRSLNDHRNRLMKVFLSFVKEFQPQSVLIENVAEILNAYNGVVSHEILETLENMGYKATVKIINAAQYGVPQLRRRAFFLARKIKPIVFPLPSYQTKSEPINLQPAFDLFESRQKPYVTVWQAISDLPSLSSGGGNNPIEYQTPPTSDYQSLMRNGNQIVYDHVARSLTTIQLERINCLGEGEGMAQLPDHLRPQKGYSGAYGRLFPQQPARTITRWVFHPGSGRFYHPYDNRVITIREAARLQSFPDWFIFTGTYIQKSHQVGEAVPPFLTRQFARSIADALKE